MPSVVDLGFAEEGESWKLESRLFPSKIGGKPAWLELENLPSVQDLQCDNCHQQMIFLCQIYAPYEEDENNFHRTLFIFICRNPKCSQRNVNNNMKVFRSSLPRINKFYSAQPSLEEPDINFSVSKCKCKITYCCRQHQVADWKNGHKEMCGSIKECTTQSKMLFKEYELVIGEEDLEDHGVDESEALNEFKRLQSEGKIGTMVDASDVDLEAHSFVDQDPAFSKFRKRISKIEDQVLRYERDGEPLWIASDPKPTEIPCCEHCHGRRRFEFQVMPQMLSVLQENELDWGVLLVYTCKNSCTDSNGYKQEFIFRQDVSLDDFKLSSLLNLKLE
ncbi:hypothetical protein FQR65_LT12978 [Abscondita terminalis]|nr:hypothetical protein FQR65_LT12978 [Abscondita terminalis]